MADKCVGGTAVPLEPTTRELETWLHDACEVVVRHIEALPTQAAAGPVGHEGIAIAQALKAPIREEPSAGGWKRVLELVEQGARASLNTPHPGYLAYIPGGGILSSAIADLVGSALNRYTGHSGAAPALAQLEADTMAWLAQAFGYGEQARGLFTSGGSLANFSAVVCARVAHLGHQGDFRKAVVYTSSQSHHSVAKAVTLAGIPPTNVRLVSTDAEYRLDANALSAAIHNDRSGNWQPFLVVGTAGTTNTGAIDPLPELATLCERHELWLHIDAAYGGAFVLCDQGQELLRGIERADSITFDPHKGLFLPYGTGCLLVRDGETLRRAHHMGADYLADFEARDQRGLAPSATDYGPELSRSFRGLRLWVPLVLHGARAFRDALEEKLRLAADFEAQLQARIEAGVPIELVTPRQLTVVAFRLRRHVGESLVSWNQRNRAWLDTINERGRVHLSSTLLPGRDGDIVTLRVCVLSVRTHEAHMQDCLEDLDAGLGAQRP